MRFLDYLQEVYVKTINAPHSKGPVAVFANPAPAELIKDIKGEYIRFMYHGNKLYVWDGDRCTHYTMADMLKINYDDIVYGGIGTVRGGKIFWDEMDRDLEFFFRKLWAGKVIQALEKTKSFFYDYEGVIKYVNDILDNKIAAKDINEWKVKYSYAGREIADKSPIIFMYMVKPNVGLLWSNKNGDVHLNSRKISRIEDYSDRTTHKNLLAAAYNKVDDFHLTGRLRDDVNTMVDSYCFINVRGRAVGDTVYIYGSGESGAKDKSYKKYCSKAVDAIYDYVPENKGEIT